AEHVGAQRQPVVHDDGNVPLYFHAPILERFELPKQHARFNVSNQFKEGTPGDGPGADSVGESPCRPSRRDPGPLLSVAAQMITTGKILLMAAGLLLSHAAFAQPAQKAAPGFPEAPGKETLLAKCFQCHTPAMWMD